MISHRPSAGAISVSIVVLDEPVPGSPLLDEAVLTPVFVPVSPVLVPDTPAVVSSPLLPGALAPVVGSGPLLTPVPVSAPCVPPPLVALPAVALESVALALLAVVVPAAPLLPLLPLELSELLPDPLVPHAAITATAPTIHRAIIVQI